MRILILCTGNSCRSQIAQAYLQSFDTRLEVYSAGTEASGVVNPLAIEVMKQDGIDISHHTSKPVDLYLNEKWDYVITVCDEANEVCPYFPGKVHNRIHMGFTDPSKSVGSNEFIMNEFIKSRDEIKTSFYNFYTQTLIPQL